MQIIESINGALQTIAEVINKYRDIANYNSDKAISDITKLTRVEPLTIVSKDLLTVEYMQDVNQAMLSMFAGYYLQSIAIMTKIQDVEVIKILDSLNPDRDETGFLLAERYRNSNESRTLMADAYLHSLPTSKTISLEDNKDAKTSDDIKTLNEISNMSVGKMLSVEIAVDSEDNKSKVIKIPINIRLMVSCIPNSTIAKILSLRSEDAGVIERFHAWRSGRISFIRDLIFCQDLIDEHKRSIITDETGTLSEMVRRVNNAKKYGLLSKNPSLASASNLFIISEEVAREVESSLGGKLHNPKIREKAFEATYAMIIAVVDRDWERVSFYVRDIPAATDLSIKEIKMSNKNKGPDIMDVMKSMSQGMNHSF